MLKFEKAGKHEKGQIQSHHEGHEGHEGSEVKPGSAGRQTGFMDLFRSKQKQPKAGLTTGAPRDRQFKTCRTGVQIVQNGFGVVPSVPDGIGQLSKMLFENHIKTETRCAQPVSKVSG